MWSDDRMTKTCATCKYVQIESKSTSYRLLAYNYFYSTYSKNIVYPELEEGEDPYEQIVKFDLFFCNHPDRAYTDSVSGEKKHQVSMCDNLREKESEFCGLSGKMWEKNDD